MTNNKPKCKCLNKKFKHIVLNDCLGYNSTIGYVHVVFQCKICNKFYDILTKYNLKTWALLDNIVHDDKILNAIKDELKVNKHE